MDWFLYDNSLRRERVNEMGWNISDEKFLVGNFPGKSLIGGNFPGGNFHGGNFPRNTIWFSAI